MATATPAVAAELAGKLVKIHDGNTVAVLADRQQVRVRLVDIEAPNTSNLSGHARGKHFPRYVAARPPRSMFVGRTAHSIVAHATRYSSTPPPPR
jgi:endonuclease YncB( thermonuclease family)